MNKSELIDAVAKSADLSKVSAGPVKEGDDPLRSRHSRQRGLSPG